MPDRIVRWEMMTPDELDEAIEHMPLALVPAGSLEWHGKHMSTGSDYLRGDAICTQVASLLDGGVVLPATWVAAPGFCNWRGTISFKPAVVKQVARELYRELDKCGFQWVFVHLAHAGSMQSESWGEPAEGYMEESDMRILIRAGSQLRPEVSLGGGHAGANEAAELMAADPDTVHLDRYDPEDTRLPKYDDCDPDLYSEGLTAESRQAVHAFMAREHYEWDPDLADRVTPEAAQRLFDEVCSRLADELREWMAS